MCISPFRTKISGNFVDLPCGRCAECVARRKLDWYTKLSFASKSADCAFFTLLSYSPDYYNFDVNDLELRHQHIKQTTSRLRSYFRRRYPDDQIKVKYYIASEFGERKERLHYHALFFIKGIKYTWLEFNNMLHYHEVTDRLTGKTFFISPFLVDSYRYEKIRNKSRHIVNRYKIREPIWQYGPVAQCFDVKYNFKRLKYTVKYIQKQYNTSYYSRFSFEDIAYQLFDELRRRDFSFLWENPDITRLPKVDANTPLPRSWMRKLFAHSFVHHRNELKYIVGYVVDNYHQNIETQQEYMNSLQKRYRRQYNFENANIDNFKQLTEEDYRLLRILKDDKPFTNIV